jgi:hypothetical protein
MARCHEEAAAPITAEAYICATLRQIDPADRLEDHDAIVSRAAAPAAPQIAIDIDAQSVCDAAFFDREEGPSVCKLAAVDDVINAKRLR